MTRFRNLALLCLCALPLGVMAATAATSAAAPTKAAAAPSKSAAAAKSEDDKTLFAIGQILSGSVKGFALTPREMQLVTAGFADGMHNSKSAANADTYRNKIQTLLAARSTQLATQAKAAGKVFRDKAAAAKDTTTMASGVIMTTLKAGTGPKPTADDQVKVHYEGKLIDGTVFDSSIQRGQPVTFKVTGVVPCWTEALQHMNVGSKIKLVCPPDLAYGDRGSPPKIPGGSTLVFDVELLDVIKAPPVAAEPATPAVPAATVPATPAPAAPAAPAATAPPK